MSGIMHKTILFAAVVLCGCDSPSPSPKPVKPAATEGQSNPNCLSGTEVAALETAPVGTTAAKRLARHYGACIFDSDLAMSWMRVAADQGDKEAMEGLATLLENSSPANAQEAIELRKKATEPSGRP
jgi:hypothetical protein